MLCVRRLEVGSRKMNRVSWSQAQRYLLAALDGDCVPESVRPFVEDVEERLDLAVLELAEELEERVGEVYLVLVLVKFELALVDRVREPLLPLHARVSATRRLLARVDACVSSLLQQLRIA